MKCEMSGEHEPRMSRILAAMLLLAFVSTSMGESVRLLPHAQISKSVVVLSDIAEINVVDEEMKKSLGTLDLGPAPEQGQSRWIDLSDIKDRLYRRGIRTNELEFSGSRRVEVTYGDSDPKAPPENQGLNTWREAIIHVVKESLNGESFPLLNKDCRREDIRVRTEADRACLYLCEHRVDEWHLIAPARWQEGWQEILLEIDDHGEFVRFPIRVLIAPARQVVALRGPIQQGKKLKADDVTLVTEELTDDPKEYIHKTELAIGLETKRDMAAGEVIRLRDMRLPPVVFRGQPVTVQVNYGTAWLQKTFIAGGDAGVGEWIEVSEANGKANRPHDYQVRVVGPHLAVLPMDAPPSRAVLNGLPRVAARPKSRPVR